jgi:two-component system chemotaxis response regulator CheY
MPNKNASFLLIDDNGVSRSIVRATLRSEGWHDIRESSRSDAGAAMARESAPDLICLDISMPGRSGVELLEEFKASLPNTAVLMVTASNDPETVEACVKGRADGYVIKPFNAQTLLRSVHSALAKVGKSA